MPEHTTLTIIVWVVFIVIWWIFTRSLLEPWIAGLFGMEVNRRFKPFGKWYGRTRGILHLKGDTSTLRWKTFLATLILWAISLPIAFIVAIWLTPQVVSVLIDLIATKS